MSEPVSDSTVRRGPAVRRGVTYDSGSVAEVATRAQQRARTVGVVSAAADRSTLLTEVGRQLRFPDYYGHNLDAFEECLTDLSWLPDGPVELVWADGELLRADPDTHRVVLEILESAVASSSAGPRPLHVVLAARGD